MLLCGLICYVCFGKVFVCYLEQGLDANIIIVFVQNDGSFQNEHSDAIEKNEAMMIRLRKEQTCSLLFPRYSEKSVVSTPINISNESHMEKPSPSEHRTASARFL